MPRTTLVALAVLATVSLTVTGCSSSGGSKPAGQGRVTSAGSVAAPSTGSKKSTSTSTAPNAAPRGTIDVCSLMTSAQASAINQVTYGPTQGRHWAAGYDACRYVNTGKHVNPIDIQALNVTVIGLPNCYSMMSKDVGPGKPISGVGDQAFGFRIGIVVDIKGTCLKISGLTDAELRGDYTNDIAMANIIIPTLPR